MTVNASKKQQNKVEAVTEILEQTEAVVCTCDPAFHERNYHLADCPVSEILEQA